jgi:hypothetical protein
MRIPVNYHLVPQSNYFLETSEEASIHNTVYRPDGYTLSCQQLYMN